MSRTIRRFGLGIGATAIAVAMTVTAAGVYAGAQDTSGQDPASGRRAGPGGQGGPGGRGPGGAGRLGGPGGRGGPGRQGGPMGGPRGILGPMGIERLGLSETQQQQVRAVIQSHDPYLEALNDRAFAARQALEAAVMADAVDEGAIRARSADVAAVEADLAVIRAKVRAEVFQLLTPEQRTKAREMPPRPNDRRPPPPVQ